MISSLPFIGYSCINFIADITPVVGEMFLNLHLPDTACTQVHPYSIPNNSIVHIFVNIYRKQEKSIKYPKPDICFPLTTYNQITNQISGQKICSSYSTS